MSVTYLAKGLAERGHRIHIACKRTSLLWQNLTGQVDVILHDVHFRSYLDLQAIKAIRKIVIENQIDLINAQGGKDRNLTILAKWVFRLNCKLVFTRRQRPRNEPWFKRWFHTQGASKIVVVSEGLKLIFLSKGYDQNHLQVIYNGVSSTVIPKMDQLEIDLLKQQLGISGKVVGCLSRKKIQEEIIYASKFLPEDYIFLFIGIEEQELEDVIKEVRPVQPMLFLGLQSHHEALKYLQLMDVNILASHMEGFGLVLVESMLCEVPVIGSNFGGIPDVIVDGKTGFLFQNGNYKQLAEKIEKVLTDNELRTSFIENGKRTAVEKFSIENTVLAYESLFSDLLVLD